MTGESYYDKNTANWDRESKHDPAKVRYIVDLLDLKGGEDILDIATGTGVLIPLFEEHDPESILATDISENMIKEAEKKYPGTDHPKVEFKVTDVYDIKENGKFDRVMCMAAFPHFEDKEKAVGIMADSLKYDGILEIAHPASKEEITKMHAMHSGDVVGHALPEIGELGKMFEENGLRVIFERDDDDYYLMVGRKEPKTFSEDEMYKILMTEFEEFKDEGKDLYIDDLIKKMREELGTDGN